MTSTPTRPAYADERDYADAGGPSRVPHRKLIIAAIVVVLVAAAATWIVAFSPVFGVKTVQVRGAQHLSAVQVRSAAAIAGGSPLVRLDTDAIRTRVEELPDVASATVTTSFPSTVTITVTERVPIGVVRAGNEYRLVDRTGQQYRAVAKRPANLPLFALPAGATAQASGSAVATVAAALSAKLRAKISSIQALNPDEITLVLADGRLVQWGSAGQSAAKARVLPALLHQTHDDSSAEIDVSDPVQPFTH